MNSFDPLAWIVGMAKIGVMMASSTRRRPNMVDEVYPQSRKATLDAEQYLKASKKLRGRETTGDERMG